MKKIRNCRQKTALCLTAVLTAGLLLGPATVQADTEEDNVFTVPYISLGADISSEERAAVLNIFGITEEELSDCVVETVTNEEEHQYLDSYVDSELIGTEAHSCAMITGAEDGHGIQVSTSNISYCTPAMYQNALATAGVQNADIVVAGGVELSGTAALVGVMDAYQTMSGTELDDDNIDAAVEELVTTGELSEALQEAGLDDGDAEQLIAAVKEVVAEKDLTDPEQIEEAVDEVAEKMDVTLTDEEKEQIISLMEKIGSLNLDPSILQGQLSDIYSKLQDIGLDLNISTEQAQGFFSMITGWFQSIGDWFNSLLGK